VDEKQSGDESSVQTVTPSPTGQQTVRPWIAPAWFLLGVLVGVMGLLAYNRLAVPPAVGAAAVREAARNGTLDAIATLQAGGSPAESPMTPTPVPYKTAFAVRPANRAGRAETPVMVVEFSDFQ
jgi:hypothetical protein